MTVAEMKIRIKDLEAQVSNEKLFEQAKETADKLYIIQTAFIHAGFTEDQAFKLMLASIPKTT
jgi:hypothetical protein